jgi:phospholipase D1/2
MPAFNQAERASKNHSRVMPFLIPPSEFKPGELTQLGLTGTCELQICRSAGPWSLGTSDRVEHSIQNAYLKGMYAVPRISSKPPNSRVAIQLSEHYVYIENQFFITSYALPYSCLLLGPNG